MLRTSTPALMLLPICGIVCLRYYSELLKRAMIGCLGLRVTGWARVPLKKPDPQSGSILTATVLALAICFSLVFAMAQTETPSAAAVPQFEDVSRRAGLAVSHISTAEQHYIIESMSGGIALFDCDDDGKLEIASSRT